MGSFWERSVQGMQGNKSQTWGTTSQLWKPRKEEHQVHGTDASGSEHCPSSGGDVRWEQPLCLWGVICFRSSPKRRRESDYNWIIRTQCWKWHGDSLGKLIKLNQPAVCIVSHRVQSATWNNVSNPLCKRYRPNDPPLNDPSEGRKKLGRFFKEMKKMGSKWPEKN